MCWLVDERMDINDSKCFAPTLYGKHHHEMNFSKN